MLSRTWSKFGHEEHTQTYNWLLSLQEVCLERTAESSSLSWNLWQPENYAITVPLLHVSFYLSMYPIFKNLYLLSTATFFWKTGMQLKNVPQKPLTCLCTGVNWIPHDCIVKTSSPTFSFHAGLPDTYSHLSSSTPELTNLNESTLHGNRAAWCIYTAPQLDYSQCELICCPDRSPFSQFIPSLSILVEKGLQGQ